MKKLLSIATVLLLAAPVITQTPVNPRGTLVIGGPSGSSSGGGAWGSISGTLSSQSDLNNELNAKQKKSYQDITEHGAVCDWNGTTGTDDTAALQAAITAVGASGGKILMPGRCRVSRADTIVWPALTGTLDIYINGELKLDTTLKKPNYVNVYGAGGALGSQFHRSGSIGKITGSGTSGTLGTNCSAGVACTFTPSTMTNLYVKTAITVADTVACSITSISRAANWVTATLSSSCHVPPGAKITLAGVTDSGFNGTFDVIKANYQTNTLIWKQTAADASSSGGTASGIDEDTVETKPITATAGATATATFTYAHNSTAQWGIVSVHGYGYAQHHFKDVTFTAGSGTSLWFKNAANIELENVSTLAWSPIRGGLEFDEAFWIYVNGGAYNTIVGSAPWAIRFAVNGTNVDDSSGFAYFNNTTIISGVKLDTSRSAGIGYIHFYNTTIERAGRGGVTVDPRNAVRIDNITFDRSSVQDNFEEYEQCAIYYTHPSKLGFVTFKDTNTLGSTCLRNDNYRGSMDVFGLKGTMDLTGAQHATPSFPQRFSVTAGGQTETELRGIGDNLSPSIIPSATATVTQPDAWVSTAGCTVTQGVLAPDGSTRAATITAPGAVSAIRAATVRRAWQAGDIVLFGAKVRSVTAVATPTASAGKIYLGGTGFGSVSFDSGSGGTTLTPWAEEPLTIHGDGWHAVMGIAKVASATYNGGQADVSLEAGCNSTGLTYYNPWMITIPASDNIPMDEIVRRARYLLHAYVPSGLAGGGGILAIDPNHKFQWGSDTNLYRGALDQVKTDDDFLARSVSAVNAVDAPSLKQGGNPISTGANVAWRCDEGAASTCADGANHPANTPNNLTVTSGTWSGATSPFKDSVVFNGTTTRLDSATQTGTNFGRNDKFSVSLAYYPGSTAGAYAVAGNLDTAANNIGWEIGTTGTNVEVVLISNSSTSNQIYVRTTTNTLTASAWHQIGFTYDGSSTAAGVTVYIDGVARATTTVTNALTADITNSKVLRIGQRHSASRQVPNTTRIANVYVWPRVLAPIEMSLLNSVPLRTPIPEYTSNKAQPNGYAGLDPNGLLPAGVLPNPTATTKGGVKGDGVDLSCNGTDKMTGFASDGAILCAADQNTGSSTRSFMFPASWNGTVPNATYLNTFQVPIYSTTALSITIPASCAGSTFFARQSSTAEEIFELKHTPCTTMTGGSCTTWGSTSTICTATVGAGTVTATFSGSGASGITSGARLEWVGGGDFSLSGVALTAKGSQTGGAD